MNAVKRIGSLLLALVLVISLLPPVHSHAAYEGIPIRNKENLAAIADNLSGTYFMDTDIVFTEADFAPGGAFYNDGKLWQPISGTFTGTLKGNGHKIIGLQINTSNALAGLFTVNDGTIRDLELTGGSINVNYTQTYGEVYAGSIAAKNTGTIENCINRNPITVTALTDITDGTTIHVGGIAGEQTTGGIIRDCGNTGAITTQSKDANVGGIVGHSDSSSTVVYVNDCFNSGTIGMFVSNSGDAGGIVGYNHSMSQIADCANSGTVTATCEGNSEKVAQGVYAGGIAGDNSSAILNSYNTGVITTDADATWSDHYTATASRCAGIAAYCGANATVRDCYNTGTVTAIQGQAYHWAQAAGIVTVNASPNVTTCYNTGLIKTQGGNKESGQIMSVAADGSSGGYTNCYYLSDTTSGEQLSPQDMTKAESFQGFDFDSDWTMESANGYTYPRLSGTPKLGYDKQLMYVTVAEKPAKKNYQVGEELDLTGGKIAVGYNTGCEILDMTAQGVTVSGFTTAAATSYDSAYVYYGGKYDSFGYSVCSGHEWADADCQNPKTCIHCGATEGGVNTSVHYFTYGICDDCGAIQISETTFPDQNFRSYIMSQSYGADGVLTNAELQSVTSIHVSGRNIKDLTGIQYFTALEILGCSTNQLTSLDVSKNTALEELHCYSNQLTSLNVSGLTALYYVNCHSNQLTELDVTGCTALETLRCYSNQLTSLDVSKNAALWSLYCSSNQLTELDVSKNTVLDVLSCASNQLTSLDVSKNAALWSLDCSSNQLTSLDVSDCTVFESLFCDSNERTVSVNRNQFDLSSLAADGFDISKASNWQGGTVSGNILTATAEKVTYTYDLGNGKTATFTLVMDGFCSHTWLDATCVDPKTCDLCGETQGEPDADAHEMEGDTWEGDTCAICGLMAGKCGDNAYWVLKDGHLRIYGSGTMTSAPWPKASITTAVIEEGITSLSDKAFENCENLTDVTIAKTVKELGSSCFYRCMNLVSVELPEGITAIPSNAFAVCYKLASIQIPESVTTIGGNAFQSCRALIGVQIPANVESMGTYVFYGCDLLKYVRFTGNAPTFDNYAFYNLTTTVFYPGYDVTWDSSVRKYYGATKLTWVAYGDTHTEHSFDANGLCSCGLLGGACGDNAIWTLDPITGTLTISGTGAMEDFGSVLLTPWTDYRNSVTTVVVEEGITHLGDAAFKEFNNLAEVSLPDSLESIGYEAFMSCPKLTDVYYGSTEKAWDKIEIAANNTPLNNATIHYTDPCVLGHDLQNLSFYKDEGSIVAECGRCGEEMGVLSITAPDAKCDPITPYTAQVENTVPNFTDYTVTYCCEGGCIFAGSHTAYLTAGDCQVKATFDLEAVRLGVAGVTAQDRAYNGNDLAEITGVKLSNVHEGADVQVDLTKLMAYLPVYTVGKQTRVTLQGVQLTGAHAKCYIINSSFDEVTIEGGVNITPAPLTIKADDQNLPLGSRIEYSNFTVTAGKILGNDAVNSVDITGDTSRVTDSGKLTVSNAQITDFQGRDVTYCYDITYLPGVLTVYCPGHNWTPADCDNPKTCSVCGTTEGSALGHNWQAADCDTPKTCSVCGDTEGDPLGHDWVAADCELPKHCKNCTATEGSALGHTWRDADCNTPKTCRVCGDTEGDPLGHTWVDADCKNPKTCSACGATEGGIGDHKWADATCDAPKTCSVCGDTEGKPLVHSWQEANCVSPERCVHCNDTRGEIDPYGHKFYNGTCIYCGVLGGQCGDQVYWTLVDGKLTVYGSGDMYHYQGAQDPWATYRPLITQLEVIDGVTSVGNYVFNGFSDLTTVTLADSVTRVGRDAFAFCEKLQTVDLGKGLTEIGDYALRSCTSLKEITVPGSVRIWGAAIFQDCTALESATLEAGVSAVGEYLFLDCTALKTVTLPEGIQSIRAGAFDGCSALEEIHIPDTTATIGDDAFNGCGQLTVLVIPGSVTNIGYQAFTGCDKLTEVYYGGTAEVWNTLLGRPEVSYLHLSCTQPEGHWTEMTNPGSCVADSYTYDGCACGYERNIRNVQPGSGHIWLPATCAAPETCSACGETRGQADPNGHTFDADHVCGNCGLIGGKWGEKHSWIFDPVTGKLTVSGAGDLPNISANDAPWLAYANIITSLELEEGITSVGEMNFFLLTNLQSAVLPQSVTYIYDHAFSSCYALEELELPEGLLYIGNYAFWSCPNYTNIVIPKKVAFIGDHAFWCEGNGLITFEGPAPQFGAFAFEHVTGTAVYPIDEPTWTPEARQNYGGTITWIADCCQEGHDWIDATCYSIKTCNRCGTTEGDSLEHNQVCGVCTACGLGLNLSDYQYTLDEAAATVTLTDYIGTAAEIHVAARYLLDGKEYRALLEATSVFRGNTAITAVTVADGVTVASDSMAEMFYGCASLKTADLSGLDTTGVTSLRRVFSECKKLVSVDVTGWDTSKVEDMGYLFDYCNALTAITGYENWNTGSVWNINKAFNRTTSIQKVDLSKWDLSQVTNSGWCFQMCYAEEILLPDDLAVMSAGFFNHPAYFQESTFTLPSGVKKIGYAHTIYDFGTDAFAEFIVPEDNGYYKAVDGILYSADGTELIAIPRGKTFENGVYEVPNTVTFMGELSFSRNYNIKTLVLPDDFVIEYVPLYDSRYILQDGHGGNDTGNLNSGTNLSIAIYCYTGITQYDVRNTNTRYEAVEGVIYSEDMTTLVAVPARYAQHLNIPEGVTTWNKEAMWADLAGNSNLLSLLENCTGVSIPSTLTQIDAEQLSMLNALADRTSSAFTITVAEGNRTFHVDPATGHLEKHSYSQSITGSSCQSQGYTTHTCSVCGDSYKDSYTETKDHEWIDATCYSLKTCNNCGLTVGQMLEHVWVEADCSRPKHCENCTATQGSALGHDWLDATCQAAKTCNRCGATEGTTGGHSWIEASCYNPRTCSVCGTIDSVAWGHDWQAVVDGTGEICSKCGATQGDVHSHTWLPATCTAPETCTSCGATRGETLSHDWQAVVDGTGEICSKCGATQGNVHSHTWLPATCTAPETCTSCGATRGETLSHNWQAATCTAAATCAVCGATEGSALGHTAVTDPAVAATCTAAGKTEGSHCGVCGTVLEAQDKIPAMGHTPVADSAVAPTCTKTGLTAGAHCVVCDQVLKAQQTVPATGHTEVTDKAVAATCTAAGKTEGKHCSVCNAVITAQQVVPAKGHTEVTDKAVAATCTAAGKTEGKHCSVCNTVITAQKEVPATGHSWKAATCSEPKTCATCGATSGYALGHDWTAGSCTTPKTCKVCGLKDGGVVHAYAHQYDYKCDACGQERTVDMTRPMVDMFRMYDPNSGEHFYTGSDVERDNLIAAGWNYEGVGFTFPLTTGDPVHRLYDPVYGEHLYTMDVEEMNMLLAQGWNYEGIAFNSGFENEVPQYRLHNPNATRGAYHFTASLEERDMLISLGWEYQGIGWYSLGA